MKTLIKIFVVFLAMSSSGIAMASIPAPTGNATQIFCDAESLTLADAAIFNTTGYTEIYWYDNADQTGSAIDPNTVVADGAIYYAFQAVDPTAEAKEVTFELIATIPAPTGDSELVFCEEEGMSIADMPVFNTTGFNFLYWFSDTAQTLPLPMDTLIEDGVTYYAFQGIGTCAVALEVVIEILPTIPAPDGDTEQFFCYEETWTLNDVVANNNNGYTQIFWYADYACGPVGDPINPTTIINDGDVYYAVQGDNGCCPIPLEVNILIPEPYPAPTGDPDQYFNEGSEFVLGEAAVYNTGTFDDIYWFTDAEQMGDPVDFDTIVEDNDVYYAFQAYCACGCNLALPLQVTFHMIPIGIADYQNNAISIYPNPVADFMNIKTNQTIDSVKLYNLQTQIVDFTYTISDGELQLDLSNCQSGIYFVKIKTDELTKTYRIIKK